MIFAAIYRLFGSKELYRKTIKMKKVVFVAFLSSLLFVNPGCLKNNACSNKSIDSERSTITAYGAAQGLTLIEHSSGVFYQIISPGSGTTPSSTSVISVKYTGKLLNGQIFDNQVSTPVSLNMNEVIKGWQDGLPLIQKGGSIRLIVPSSLGYGCTGFGGVPGDSILDFTIELVDVH